MTQLASSTPTSRDKAGSSKCFCVLLLLLWLLILKEMFVKCGFRDEILEKWSLHLLDNLSNCLIRAPENFQSLKSPNHFLNLWSIFLLLFRHLICLSLYELLKSLKMFETGSVPTAGDEALKYHCLYKYHYVRKWNVSFPALVNLQLEFLVIGAFILIMEERFRLVLMPQILQAQQYN